MKLWLTYWCLLITFGHRVLAKICPLKAHGYTSIFYCTVDEVCCLHECCPQNAKISSYWQYGGWLLLLGLIAISVVCYLWCVRSNKNICNVGAPGKRAPPCAAGRIQDAHDASTIIHLQPLTWVEPPTYFPHAHESPPPPYHSLFPPTTTDI